MRKSIANYFDDFLRANSEAGVVSFKEHKELLNKFNNFLAKSGRQGISYGQYFRNAKDSLLAKDEFNWSFGKIKIPKTEVLSKLGGGVKIRKTLDTLFFYKNEDRKI